MRALRHFSCLGMAALGQERGAPDGPICLREPPPLRERVLKQGVVLHQPGDAERIRSSGPPAVQSGPPQVVLAQGAGSCHLQCTQAEYCFMDSDEAAFC